jgi:hypothetical protein
MITLSCTCTRLAQRNLLSAASYFLTLASSIACRYTELLYVKMGIACHQVLWGNKKSGDIAFARQSKPVKFHIECRESSVWLFVHIYCQQLRMLMKWGWGFKARNNDLHCTACIYKPDCVLFRCSKKKEKKTDSVNTTGMGDDTYTACLLVNVLFSMLKATYVSFRWYILHILSIECSLKYIHWPAPYSDTEDDSVWDSRPGCCKVMAQFTANVWEVCVKVSTGLYVCFMLW